MKWECEWETRSTKSFFHKVESNEIYSQRFSSTSRSSNPTEITIPSQPLTPCQHRRWYQHHHHPLLRPQPPLPPTRPHHPTLKSYANTPTLITDNSRFSVYSHTKYLGISTPSRSAQWWGWRTWTSSLIKYSSPENRNQQRLSSGMKGFASAQPLMRYVEMAITAIKCSNHGIIKQKWNFPLWIFILTAVFHFEACTIGGICFTKCKKIFSRPLHLAKWLYFNSNFI